MLIENNDATDIKYKNPDSGELNFLVSNYQFGDVWFGPKWFDDQRFYERLGIRVFKKILPAGGDLILRYFRQKKIDIFKNLTSVENPDILKLTASMTKAWETMHLVILFESTRENLPQLLNGDVGTIMGWVTFNTLVNAYPIMLQRYNRLRLYRTIDRMVERNSKRTEELF